MKKYIKLILKSKYVLFLLVITFFAVKPLLHSGLPPTHDGEYHVIRVYEFDKALRDGNLYPRWAADLNNGYGVPLFNYVYPMPNYFGEIFHTFGASFIDAFKLNLLVATLVSVLFFYFWARLFLGNTAALTAAIFYAFAPYRFVDVYVRGSVGEVWALAFFPAFLWSLTFFFKKKKVYYFVLSAVFFSATIFSHNILALMFTLFGTTYAAYLISKSNDKKLFLRLTSYILLLGLGMSAVFWLPALAETKYVEGLQIYNVDANFPELFQLLIPSWGTGFSGGNLQNQMSFQIGVANLFAVFISIILILKYARKKVKNKGLLLFFLSWFVLIFYVMLDLSKPVWHTVPLLYYFQFPWRFLSLMIIICSFIAGIVIEMIKGKKTKVIFTTIFIVIAVLTTISYTEPAYYHDRKDDHYLTRNNFIHGTNSPGDFFNTKWMNTQLPLKKKKIEVIGGHARVIMEESKSSVYRFNVESEGGSALVANVAYFPGWTLHMDDKHIELQKTKDGLIGFSVPQGKHMVELRFGDTMIRKLASGLSLGAFLICIGLLFLRKKL
jgi:uncharacterized membrane protein